LAQAFSAVVSWEMLQQLGALRVGCQLPEAMPCQEVT